MTVRAPFSGFVPLGGGATVFEEDPVDALVSQALLSNVLHASDSAGQVIVCDGEMTLQPLGDAEIGEWQHIVSYPYAAKVREDGTIYPLRVQCAMRRSGSASTQTVRIAVAPPGLARGQIEMGTSVDNVAEFSSSTTTLQWFAPQLIEYSAAGVASAVELVQTVDPAGDPVGMRVTRLAVSVWGSSSIGTGAVAEVNGIYAAEYVGTT